MSMIRSNLRKKLMIAGALAAGTAISLGSVTAAQAETITTISGVGASAGEAVGDALARCMATGGSGGGQLDSFQNADGSWVVTIECVSP